MHPMRKGVAIASLTSLFIPTDGFVEIEEPGAPERTANARLIAAAPELLYALSQLLGALPAKRDWLDPMVEAVALDAVQKATGSS
jgi:hypothetical protein